MKNVIISTVNNKGGIGKTTVSCNLAHALTRHKKKVLVIDMDSQCNATSLLLPKGSVIKQGLYELFDTGDISVEKCIRPSEYENLWCLPNVSETAGLEPDLIRNSPDSFFRLRKAVRKYALENFDFTIIDTPPNMGTFVIMSLYASDFVIVPSEADSAFSMEGLVKAMQLIRDIRENGNPDLRFLRLLINRVDRRTSISRVGIQHIKKSFQPDQFFQTTIPVNTDFRQAEHYRQTVFRYKSGAPGAKAYRKLAAELLDILSD